MTELKTLPEQEFLHDDWYLSKEFRKLIDKIPHYDGILLEDGKTVELGFLESFGYNPKVSLDYYLLGLPYALAIHKGTTTYIPEGLKEEMKRKIDDTFEDVIFWGKRIIEYSGDSKKLKRELIKSDAEK